jgi:RNA polymerase sigma factor for flagellar operon FliA
MDEVNARAIGAHQRVDDSMPVARLTGTSKAPRAVREQRDRLIREHVALARLISLSMVRARGPTLSREDAIAAALLGLTEAAERYDASRGESFAVFAKKRIRGAVLDELRRDDFLPRRIRRIARGAARVRAELAMTGEPITDEAMARALGVTPAEYRDEIAPLADACVHSIDGGATAIELTGGCPSPEIEAGMRQALSRVAAAVQRMSTRDATILAMRYGDDLPYREIAKTLGLTAARVCQIHGRVLDRIRSAATASELDAASSEGTRG